MAITSCTQLALLAFASVAIFGLLVKAEVCEDKIGSCEGIVCNQVCIDRHPGSKGTCDGSNLCICYFECPEKGKCNDGLGHCSSEFNNDKCGESCANKHPGGVGYCDDSLGAANALCQCQYPC